MRIIPLTLVLSFCINAFAFAGVIKSEFFTVEHEDGINLQEIYEELLLVPDAAISVNKTSKASFDDKFRQRLDNLFHVVSDIMDIHLRNASFNLVILATDSAVADFVQSILKQRVEAPSFYDTQSNTIYISAASFRTGILGHELGHAIINHYFVVPPPEKMQEVLCGYVEYTLLKGQPKE